MGAEMWSVSIDEAGRLSEVRAPLPVPGSGEVLVRVLAAGIAACDLARHGNGPSAAALSEGHRPVVGMVGTVEQADPEHSALAGRPVAVMPAVACPGRPPGSREHPAGPRQEKNAPVANPWLFAEWVAVPAGSVVPLLSGRLLEEATLLGVAAGTLSAVRKARVEIGESVAVVGTAAASLLAAQWVRVAGAYDVYIVDNDTRGLALARKLWLGERIDLDLASAAGAVRAQRGGRGVDLAVVVTGDGERLRLAFDLVDPGGRVLALHTAGAADPVECQPAPHGDSVRLLEASTNALCASRFYWEIAARTWGSGRLALRDLIAERVSVPELVARTKAHPMGGEGFMVVLAPDRD
ncbi:MAG: zinc-binding dehydrogenase [Anaerolineae bacterium]